jgi:hypothetical protein
LAGSFWVLAVVIVFSLGCFVWRAAGRAQVKDSLAEGFEGVRVQAVAGSGSFDFAFYEPGILEDFEVLADSGLGQGEDLDADAAAGLDEVAEDAKTDGVCEGF